MKIYIASALLGSLTLVGCGESTEEATAPEEITVVDTIEQAYVSPLPDGTITYKLAMIDYEPFHFLNAHGGHVGYDVDIIHAVGEEAGFKVEISEIPQTFGGLLDEVNSGKYDIAMSGLSITPGRQAKMANSNPYSKGKAGYLVKADSEFKNITELDSAKVSVIENSSLTDIVRETNAEVILEQTNFLSYQNVFTGKSEAAFAMQPTVLFNANQFSENPVRFIPLSEPIKTTIYTSKKSTEIINKFNDGLEKIKSNGRYHKINEKWFGSNASKIEVN